MSGHQPKGRGYSPSNKPPNMGSGVRPASWADPYGYGTGRPEDRQVEDLLSRASCFGSAQHLEPTTEAVIARRRYWLHVMPRSANALC